MQNKLFIFLLLVFCCNGLIAQEYDDGPVDRSYRLALGPKVGAGVALGSHSNQQNLTFSPNLSYQLGGAFNAHFGRRYDLSEGGTGWLGLQVEVLFSQRNLKLASSTMGERCFEMPVLAQLYLSSSLAFEAGTTFVHVLKCTPSQVDYQGTHLNVGDISGNDVMLTVGACYKMSKMTFDARYNMGMSGLAGNLDTKVSTLVLSAIYHFIIVK